MSEQELFELCLSKAQAIIQQVKLEYSPNGIVDDARNDVGGADPKAPTAQESTAVQTDAYNRSFPTLLQSIVNSIGPLDAATTASLKQNAPQIAQLQNDTNLAGIQGSGGQAAIANQGLQQQIDPEYYATRNASANKLMDLINNPISGSEQASIERANNQNALGGGRLGLNTNQQTLSNAMNFGAAGRDRLGQALTLATQSIPTYRSGTDSFAQATGQGGTISGLQGSQGANQAGSLSTNAQNNIAGFQNTAMGINANRRDRADREVQTLGDIGRNSSSAGGAAAACCWIFMEAYKGKMPNSVRLCRNYFYNQDKRLSIGYKKMAKWLVPKMQRNKFWRICVWLFMIKPITRHGEYLAGYSNKSRVGLLATKIWFNIWRTI